MVLNIFENICNIRHPINKHSHHKGDLSSKLMVASIFLVFELVKLFDVTKV